jgi:hypothetical protein
MKPISFKGGIGLKFTEQQRITLMEHLKTL